MGPVNWPAVIVAAVLAFFARGLWYGPLFGRVGPEEVGASGLAARANPVRSFGLTLALLIVSAAMLGHMFARIGEGVLHTKPWLYFMMSGGLAVAFVVPALWISQIHRRESTRHTLTDAGYWVVAYLTMGLVFWALP
jgi:hypothetical protein